MKKSSILVSALITVLLLAYFVQVYFMSEASKNLYDKFVASKSEYYTILDSNITKGLFNSKAEFLIKINGNNILASLDESTQSYQLVRLLRTIERIDGINFVVNTKNNIFAKNNVEVLLLNPSYDENSQRALANVKYPLALNFDLSLGSTIKSDLALRVADMNVSDRSERLFSKNTYFLLKDFSFDSYEFNALEFNSDDFLAGSGKDIVEVKKLSYVEKFKKAISMEQYRKAYILGEDLFESKGVFSLDKLSFKDVTLNNMKLEAQVEKNDDKSFNMPFKLSIQEISNSFSPSSNLNLDLNMQNMSIEWFNTLSNNSENFYFDLFSSTSPKIKLNDFSMIINNANISAKADATFDKGVSKANVNIVSDKKMGEINFMFALLGLDSMFVKKDDKYVLDFIYDDSDKNNIIAKLNGEDASQNFKNSPFSPYSQDDGVSAYEGETGAAFTDENISDEEGIFDGEVKNPNSTN